MGFVAVWWNRERTTVMQEKKIEIEQKIIIEDIFM